jgi:dTDP-glucose pyrophosphorylase
MSVQFRTSQKDIISKINSAVSKELGVCCKYSFAAGFIATLQKRQGLMVACPEEIAYRNQWISANDVEKIANQLSKSSYGQYLKKILTESV